MKKTTSKWEYIYTNTPNSIRREIIGYIFYYRNKRSHPVYGKDIYKAAKQLGFTHICFSATEEEPKETLKL